MPETELNFPATQQRFADLVGVSQQRVGQLQKRGVLIEGDTLAGWIKSYVSHLRRQRHDPGAAAARDRFLAARTAYEELRTKRLAKESVPVELLALILAATGARIGSILENLPERIKREIGSVDPAVVAMIRDEIISARNEAAMLEFPSDTVAQWVARQGN
jgi:phage terminase Nu1 subunit (DNA packaging protein)